MPSTLATTSDNKTSQDEAVGLSVLLPCYNEHDNLPIITYLLSKTLNATPSISKWEIIIVDDNSPDGTGAIADRLASPHSGLLGKHGSIKVLKRPGKMGLGSAYMHALQHATCDYVCILDADLSHHPKYIPRMLALLQALPKLDIVTGTRYAAGGSVYGWDAKRKVVSRGANFLADLLLAPGVSDLTGSFRVYRRRALARLMPTVRTKGYTFQMEIMVRARSLGMQVGEVGISFVDRQFGESKLGTGEIVGYLKGLWTLFTTV